MIDLNPNRTHYYIQTNSEISKLDSCQSSAVAESLEILHYDIDKIPGKFKQADDRLFWYLRNNEKCLAKYKISHPGSKVPPNEWLDIIVYGVDLLFPNACYYDENLTIKKIITDISKKNTPVNLSCRFSKISGHYITVVGMNNNDLLIDDPYKDTLHQKADGYHCRYSVEELSNHMKGYGIRWNKNES
jgi:hypothetical protein